MDWVEENNVLIKEFTLNSFSEIVKALTKIGSIADEMDHHPDFQVFGYKHIKFTLKTHSERMVTQLDYDLAKEIDRILG